MTTATYTQGLQAMYPSLQQIPGQVPVQQFVPQQQFAPQYGIAPMTYAQQAYGPLVAQQQVPQYISPSLYGQKIHRQQIAAELFRLAQLVQYSSQFVGPQPDKPHRLTIAAELHKLAQQVEQSIQAQQQYRQQFAQPQFGPQQQFAPQAAQLAYSVPVQVPMWT